MASLTAMVLRWLGGYLSYIVRRPHLTQTQLVSAWVISGHSIRRWFRHVAYHSGKGRSLSDDTPATTFNAIEP